MPLTGDYFEEIALVKQKHTVNESWEAGKCMLAQFGGHTKVC